MLSAGSPLGIPIRYRLISTGVYSELLCRAAVSWAELGTFRGSSHAEKIIGKQDLGMILGDKFTGSGI